MSLFTGMRQYGQDHWRGRHSLRRAFLLNTCLLNLMLLRIQHNYILDGITNIRGDVSRFNIIVLLLISVAWALLLVWQITGAMRSASGKYSSSSSGTAQNLYIVFLGSVCVFFVVLSGLFDLYAGHMQNTHGKLDIYIPADKTYTLIANTTTAQLSGRIDFGVSKDFKELLERNTKIRHLILDSPGGIIVEARGLSNILINQNISTHVDGQCMSACTLAFIGGPQRTVGLQARLGFHQYQIESNTPHHWVYPAGEQLKDRKRFANQGVEAWFLDKMFKQTPDSIWIPSHDELLDAGILRKS